MDEFIEWIDKYCIFDDAPWMIWFDETYCKKCKSVVINKERTGYCSDMECSWCELNNKCKFFLELKNTPDNKQIIKMWLEREV